LLLSWATVRRRLVGCFINAMRLAAGKMKVALPADLALTPKWTWAQLAVIYFLQARLNVSLPGLHLDLLASDEFFDLAHKHSLLPAADFVAAKRWL
jgi:organic hydroperoxide reductase OsmC/OhrA